MLHDGRSDFFVILSWLRVDMNAAHMQMVFTGWPRSAGRWIVGFRNHGFSQVKSIHTASRHIVGSGFQMRCRARVSGAPSACSCRVVARRAGIVGIDISRSESELIASIAWISAWIPTAPSYADTQSDAGIYGDASSSTSGCLIDPDIYIFQCGQNLLIVADLLCVK